jgi:hypothetical protein
MDDLQQLYDPLEDYFEERYFDQGNFIYEGEEEDDDEEVDDEQELDDWYQQVDHVLQEHMAGQRNARNHLITAPTPTNSPPFQYPWSLQVEQRGRRNVQRMQEWRHAKEQVKYWQNKARELLCERKHHAQSAHLTTNPAQAWPKLSHNEKWRKETLLQCLQCPTGVLPKPLTEREWHRNVPASLQDDVDLWEARLQRVEFATAYRNTLSLTATESSTLHLTGSVLGSKQLVMKLLEVYPEGLFSHTLSNDLLEDIEVFAAALKVPTCFHNEQHRGFLLRFSDTLRGDPMLFLDHATDTMSFQDIMKVALANLSNYGYFVINLAKKDRGCSRRCIDGGVYTVTRF